MKHAPAVAVGGLIRDGVVLLPRGERFYKGQSLYLDDTSSGPCGIVVETFSGPVTHFSREMLELFDMHGRGDVLTWLEEVSGEFEVTLDHWLTFVRWNP